MSKVPICRCEEITEDEIRQAIEEGACTVNGVKKRTGAGMGLCQGRTCRKLIARMIEQHYEMKPGEVESSTVRAPVRPVKVDTFLCQCEPPEKNTNGDGR